MIFTLVAPVAAGPYSCKESLLDSIVSARPTQAPLGGTWQLRIAPVKGALKFLREWEQPEWEPARLLDPNGLIEYPGIPWMQSPMWFSLFGLLLRTGTQFASKEDFLKRLRSPSGLSSFQGTQRIWAAAETKGRIDRFLTGDYRFLSVPWKAYEKYSGPWDYAVRTAKYIEDLYRCNPTARVYNGWKYWATIHAAGFADGPEPEDLAPGQEK